MLNITIKNIRNIKHCTFDIDLSQSIYAFVGDNGCGKSTIMLCLAQLISKHFINFLNKNEYSSNSRVIFSFGNEKIEWLPRPMTVNVTNNFYPYKSVQKTYNWSAHPFFELNINGMYEGSLFYGARFKDSKFADRLIDSNQIGYENLVVADDYIKQNLSFILHGNYNWYNALLRIRNRDIANNLGFDNTPYFIAFEDKLISQYRMSSGECLLISLLHFVYNAIIRKSLPRDRPILILIDEMELALHPIAVSRFVEFLDKIVQDSENVTVIVTTHSSEVMRTLQPKNILKIENNNGDCSIVTPCYPSYAIRDIYKHDGFDFLLLVEDELARHVVLHLIRDKIHTEKRLIHVLPAGGWCNILSLQKDIISNNILGVGRSVLSILDGDIRDKANENVEYRRLKKLFLPFPSIEKLIFSVVLRDRDRKLFDLLSDKYFMVESLSQIVADFVEKNSSEEQKSKQLYSFLIKKLSQYRISENEFLVNFSSGIFKHYDYSSFIGSLNNIIAKQH